MKILTIIIPSYNISKFIDKIMNSLLCEEVIDKLQILLVNDGSTDNTLELAQIYEKQYPNSIQVLDKENGGHGSTINYGIKFAQGKYVKVIDGDDWVDSKVLVQLVNYLKKIDVDVVAANYCCINDNTNLKEEIQFKNIKYGKIYNFNIICKDISKIDFHSIIYNRKILLKNKYLLDKHCFYVDNEYVLYPLLHVNTIVFFKGNFYMYRLGDINQSASIESLIRNRKNLRKVSISLAKFYNNEKNNMSKNKKDFILRRINTHIALTYIILLEAQKESMLEIKAFDKELRYTSKLLYSKVPMFIKIFRFFNYKGISILGRGIKFLRKCDKITSSNANNVGKIIMSIKKIMGWI